MLKLSIPSAGFARFHCGGCWRWFAALLKLPRSFRTSKPLRIARNRPRPVPRSARRQAGGCPRQQRAARRPTPVGEVTPQTKIGKSRDQKEQQQQRNIVPFSGSRSRARTLAPGFLRERRRPPIASVKDIWRLGVLVPQTLAAAASETDSHESVPRLFRRS